MVVREEADRLLEAMNPSAEDLEQLRSAFVPSMVRIDADGNYFRRRALLGELPAPAELEPEFRQADLTLGPSAREGAQGYAALRRQAVIPGVCRPPVNALRVIGQGSDQFPTENVVVAEFPRGIHNELAGQGQGGSLISPTP